MAPTAGKHHKSLLFCGLFVSTFLFFTLSYSRGWNTWNIPSHQEWTMDPRQKYRKDLINEECAAENEAFSEELSKSMLSNLVVDVDHRLIYCFVPKVASTNLKRLMLVLKNGEPYMDPRNVTADVHSEKYSTLLSNFSMHDIKTMLRDYTKFVFVRDPFVRLISAYRDKISQTYEPFYTNYVRDIIRLYTNLNPPTKVEDAHAMHVLPSFNNFIQYLVDPRTEEKMPFEPHWRQMYRLCHLCHIQYDFIGHQETLEEDIGQLMKIFNLPKSIKPPPSNTDATNANSVFNWFKTVPLEDRRKLYKLYEKDFKLFGYRRPDELL